MGDVEDEYNLETIKEEIELLEEFINTKDSSNCIYTNNKYYYINENKI